MRTSWIKHRTRRRAIALLGGLVFAAACLAMPLAALAAPGISCYCVEASQHCDGTLVPSAPTLLAFAFPDPIQIPKACALAQRVSEPSDLLPAQLAHGSAAPRAPPLS